jgi:hypothetical protein
MATVLLSLSSSTSRVIEENEKNLNDIIVEVERKSHWTFLPNVIFSKIGIFQTIQDRLCGMNRACRTWHTLLLDGYGWEYLEIPNSNKTQPAIQTFVNHFSHHLKRLESLKLSCYTNASDHYTARGATVSFPNNQLFHSILVTIPMRTNVLHTLTLYIPNAQDWLNNGVLLPLLQCHRLSNLALICEAHTRTDLDHRLRIASSQIFEELFTILPLQSLICTNLPVQFEQLRVLQENAYAIEHLHTLIFVQNEQYNANLKWLGDLKRLRILSITNVEIISIPTALPFIQTMKFASCELPNDAMRCPQLRHLSFTVLNNKYEFIVTMLQVHSKQLLNFECIYHSSIYKLSSIPESNRLLFERFLVPCNFPKLKVLAVNSPCFLSLIRKLSRQQLICVGISNYIESFPHLVELCDEHDNVHDDDSMTTTGDTLDTKRIDVIHVKKSITPKIPIIPTTPATSSSKTDDNEKSKNQTSGKNIEMSKLKCLMIHWRSNDPRIYFFNMYYLLTQLQLPALDEVNIVVDKDEYIPDYQNFIQKYVRPLVNSNVTIIVGRYLNEKYRI